MQTMHRNPKKLTLNRYRQLQRKWRGILRRHPNTDPDNVWHTLILLELPPIERLRRGLIRGQMVSNRLKDKLTVLALENSRVTSPKKRSKRK
jgi:hypothetical protein